ncbi:MAG: ATP-binding protein [Cyanobacteria bacterium J06560_6]
MSLIDASPTKNFFVEMLTRDIDIKDAILDLLDNCIDGIQRTTRGQALADRPYEGFWANIELSDKVFLIEDNCGGIPLTVAERYAFRMGKPKGISDDDDIFTIGTYGIGMKRAIFKMGKAAEVLSETTEDAFKVSIQPDWLASDDSWELPVEVVDGSEDEKGTSIEILELREEAARQFGDDSFQDSLVREIEGLYSYILAKGFAITLNGEEIEPRPIVLQWEGVNKLKKRDTEAIAPYLYEATRDNVEISLAVGLRRKLPTAKEVDKASERTERKRSARDDAGWTIVCNDRVVVANDKTILTGWGESGIPRYHPQFISISGIVHFKSTDARLLPITTTKRGIDASSELYLYVKERMREGLRLFTSHTNKWKQVSQAHQNPKQVKADKPPKKSRPKLETPDVMFERVRAIETPEATKSQPKIWKSVKSDEFEVERRYIPNLPSPPVVDQPKRVSFNKPIEEIQLVGEFLLDDPDCSPSAVGEACFQTVLEQAQEAAE